MDNSNNTKNQLTRNDPEIIKFQVNLLRKEGMEMILAENKNALVEATLGFFQPGD